MNYFSDSPPRPPDVCRRERARPREMVAIVGKRSITPVEQAAQYRCHGQQIEREAPPDPPHHVSIRIGTAQLASIVEQQAKIEQQILLIRKPQPLSHPLLL